MAKSVNSAKACVMDAKVYVCLGTAFKLDTNLQILNNFEKVMRKYLIL